MPENEVKLLITVDPTQAEGQINEVDKALREVVATSARAKRAHEQYVKSIKRAKRQRNALPPVSNGQTRQRIVLIVLLKRQQRPRPVMPGQPNRYAERRNNTTRHRSGRPRHRIGPEKPGKGKTAIGTERQSTG